MHDSGSGDVTARGGVANDGLTRILIVDDHPAVRYALIQSVNYQPDLHVCGEAGSGTQALTLIDEVRPDLVIVDLSLPDIQGHCLVEQIHHLYPDLLILVYSMYDERVFAERLLGAGASGYVMKNAPTSVVIEAIRTVMQGEVYVSKEESKRLLNKLSVKKKESPSHREAPKELTEREKEIFEMLGDGASIPEIAQKLGLHRKTVEAYRRQAKNKLGLKSVSSLIQFAVKSRL